MAVGAVAVAAIIGVSGMTHLSVVARQQRPGIEQPTCRTAPLNPVRLASLVAADQEERPGAKQGSLERASSDVVDLGVLKEVERTAAEIVACMNDGDVLRTYALYSEDVIAAGVSLSEAEIEASPEALPQDERIVLLDVTYPVALADGRVGVVLLLDDPRVASPVEPVFAVFREIGGQWLVDELPTPFLIDVEPIP